MNEKHLRMPALTQWMRLDCGDHCPFIGDCVDNYRHRQRILEEMQNGVRPSLDAQDVWSASQADVMQANIAAITCEIGPRWERRFKIFGKKVLKCSGTQAQGTFIPSASSL